MITPVILSGGSGSRLWPLSRQQRPKQFLPVVDDDTLFQSTVLRLGSLLDMADPIIVCNEDHRFMVAEDLRQMGRTHQGILLEPVARNTAPAIALAALQILHSDGEDDLMLVLPADHVIADTVAFGEAVKRARPVAEDGHLLTFGIVPRHAETGFGYIKMAESALDGTEDVFPVQVFVEKPDQATAEAYLADGGYLWNSGMFMFKASVYLAELEHYQPEVFGACQLAMQLPRKDMEFLRVDVDGFSACPSISVDYAVMEKTSRAAVVPLDAGWNDVGAWSAVWDIGQKDDAGNVVRGEAILHESEANLVYTEQRLVALLGVDNLVVVDTKDATLVAHKDKVQKVKEIVEQLKQDGRSEAIEHREVNRPWGTYDCTDSGERFQVKRITVKPGARLSLQKHHHRAEHWIVVRGTAEVTCDEKVFYLSENQSTYIPLGSVHRLANPGKLPLELIEVQSGSYLGEDDIERFDDVYGREGK
jgi:mannose-1-phosphate guanylyltransferase/mannose-6-phosphate isomerase